MEIGGLGREYAGGAGNAGVEGWQPGGKAGGSADDGVGGEDARREPVSAGLNGWEGVADVTRCRPGDKDGVHVRVALIGAARTSAGLARFLVRLTKNLNV